MGTPGHPRGRHIQQDDIAFYRITLISNYYLLYKLFYGYWPAIFKGHYSKGLLTLGFSKGLLTLGLGLGFVGVSRVRAWG